MKDDAKHLKAMEYKYNHELYEAIEKEWGGWVYYGNKIIPVADAQGLRDLMARAKVDSRDFPLFYCVDNCGYSQDDSVYDGFDTQGKGLMLVGVVDKYVHSAGSFHERSSELREHLLEKLIYDPENGDSGLRVAILSCGGGDKKFVTIPWKILSGETYHNPTWDGNLAFDANKKALQSLAWVAKHYRDIVDSGSFRDEETTLQTAQWHIAELFTKENPIKVSEKLKAVRSQGILR